MIFAISLCFILSASLISTQNANPSNATMPGMGTGNETVPTEADIEQPPCKRGNKIGSFLIMQPNTSSLWYVGRNYTVAWKYSNFATKKPQIVDLKIQEMTPGVSITWKKILAQDVQIGNATSLLLTLPTLSDGGYKLRLVGNKKEIFYLPAEKPEKDVCFEDGEVVPGVSAEFRVVNLRVLNPTRDRFPPCGASGAYRVGLDAGVMFLTVLGVWLM